jgi:thiol-disulfide isomerase/thioredoxin
MNRVVLVFLFLGVLAGAVPAFSGYENIVLQDMDGNEVRVDSLLAEGPVVLNFWATWCRPCRVEMPHIEKIAADLASRKVHFAAISLDARNRRTQLEKYIVKNEIKLPVYLDAQGTVAKRFKVAAIPTTVVLNGEAEIHFRTKGYRPGDEVLLKKKIEALLPEEEEGAAREAASEEEAPDEETSPDGGQTEAPRGPDEEAPKEETGPVDTGE